MSQQKPDSYVYVCRTEKGGRIRCEGEEMLVNPGDIYCVGTGSGEREFIQEQNPVCSKIQASFGRKVFLMAEDLQKDWAYGFSNYVSERLRKVYPVMNCCRNEAVDLEVLEVFEHA